MTSPLTDPSPSTHAELALGLVAMNMREGDEVFITEPHIVEGKAGYVLIAPDGTVLSFAWDDGDDTLLAFLGDSPLVDLIQAERDAR